MRSASLEMVDHNEHVARLDFVVAELVFLVEGLALVDELELVGRNALLVVDVVLQSHDGVVRFVGAVDLPVDDGLDLQVWHLVIIIIQFFRSGLNSFIARSNIF